jgi:hypothetical protein
LLGGQYPVEVEDIDFSYGLNADGVRVVSFADWRIGYRQWAIRTSGRSPSVEDRFDYDVDELVI